MMIVVLKSVNMLMIMSMTMVMAIKMLRMKVASALEWLTKKQSRTQDIFSGKTP